MHRTLCARYHSIPSGKRHWYEVIRSDRPCHLYFDLEYSKTANPGLDPNGRVDCLLHLVGAALW